jgi:DNA topoisomerase VI subunit B
MSNHTKRSKQPTLDRATFTSSRDLEFFTENELTMQIGHPADLWPLALVKELIDNALDACEYAHVTPKIQVVVGADDVTVTDNGPGLPAETLDRSLDPSVRVSDKAYYISPTRGQLGNALKCLWAAPFVANGQHGLVEVTAGAICHSIEASVDHILRKPLIRHKQRSADVKNGTSVRLRWPQIACFLDGSKTVEFYNDREKLDAEEADPLTLLLLVQGYAAFNKHASFGVRGRGKPFTVRAADRSWEKWMPWLPTCPHWYTTERLRDLIAAYLALEREGGKALSVREFTQMFAGLRGSAKQQEVTRAARLHGSLLAHLIRGDSVDLDAVASLLAAMQQASRPVRSKALGMLGEEHLSNCLVRDHEVDAASVRYKKIASKDGLPFIVEVAFGIKRDECDDWTVLCGVNWSPALRTPFEELPRLLGQMRIDSLDPVVLLVHLVCPRVEAIDHGKTRVSLPKAVQQALAKCVRLATEGWKQLKKQADRHDRQTARQLEEARRAQKRGSMSIQEAAFAVMRRAYLETSDNGALPAGARQIMYKARPLVLERTGGRCWKKSNYFTQKLLPLYLESFPDETADWDVVFDARGHLHEPYTGRRVGLGTMEVRQYVCGWATEFSEAAEPPEVRWLCPTSGPANRFQFALFVEKEGFDSLLARSRIADRFGVAIMSTKGMTVTAARALIEQLSEAGVTILVIRDFDKAGFSIMHTMRSDTDRYKYHCRPQVIDLGLRLEDVRRLGLSSEKVEYGRRRRHKRPPVDPRINLRNSGASEEECDFLVRRQMDGGWWEGERVELNAIASRQFIEWLEAKLTEHGVLKLIPDAATLARAYRRATRLARLQRTVEDLLADDEEEPIDVPHDLEQQVREAMQGNTNCWDSALGSLVRSHATRHD